MSDLGWRAEGIENAEAAGGITLELYRRPGFVHSYAIRRLRGPLASGSAFDIAGDPDPPDDPPGEPD